MENHAIMLLIAWILILTLTSCQGAYVFNRKKVRTTPDPKVPTTKRTGKPWVGGGAKPLVPGNKTYFTGINIVSHHGESCSSYENQDRGVYYHSDTMIKSTYYPWASYVKNCEISKFLYCPGAICECFPGYYWNSTAENDPFGRCHTGYQQDCSTFKQYDFWLEPVCGDGMRCGSEGKCICLENQVLAVYSGPKKVQFTTSLAQETVHNCKHTPLTYKDKCYEYGGQEWTKCTASKTYERRNLTRTDCGDHPDKFESITQLYCRFDANLTGKPEEYPNKTRKWNYGQRKDGTCECTDPLLGWNIGQKKCEPLPTLTPCFGSGSTSTVTINAWNNVNKTTVIGLKRDCGHFAKCVHGKCQCIDSPNNHEPYAIISGFCSNETATTIGEGKHIGDNCSFGTPTVLADPCHLSGHQECVDFRCDCKKGYGPSLEPDKEGKMKLVCNGLYGVKCRSIADCSTGAGFECVPVPELAFVDSTLKNDSIPPLTYCVCETNHLNVLTGRCGAGSLTPTRFGLALIVLLYLGNFNFFKS